MSLSEKEREAAFPVHIDLGRKDSFGPATPAPPSGKKTKPRVFYPTLYIDSVKGLEKLPRKGCMLVEYQRTRLSVEENMDGKETAGATLEIRALCLPEDMGDNGGTLEDAFKKLGRGEKADDGNYYSEDED